jgi:type I restriction enzyme, S subunit
LTPRASITLSDECELITKGTTPSTLGLRHQDHGIPFIRAQNLVDGTVSIEADPLFIDQTTHDLLRRSKIKPSDILLSIAGTIGRAAIVPANAGEMNCNQAVAIIRPSSRIDPRFLLHWLSSRDAVAQVTKGKVTGTISNLSLGQIGNLKIPLPSPDEQRRIASTLDKADALRRARKHTIALLQNLARSLFLEIFGNPGTNPKGWSWGRIGDLLDGVHYGTSAKAGDKGKYPILRMGNITTDGRMDFEDLKYIDLNDKDLDKFTLRRGDILFNRTNSAELVGKTAVFDRDELFAFAGYLVRARATKGVSPYYISGYLNSDYGKTTLRAMAKSIVGMANINAKEMQAIAIPLPDAQSQAAYSNGLASIEKSLAVLHRHLKCLDLLFASLQHRAFAGEPG